MVHKYARLLFLNVVHEEDLSHVPRDQKTAREGSMHICILAKKIVKKQKSKKKHTHISDIIFL